MSESSHFSKRSIFIIAAGAIVIIAMMAGVILAQTDSNVSEVSISSTLTSMITRNSQSESGTSGSTTSEYSSTSSSSSYSGPTGILGVSLTDPPIVPPGVTDVYISYSSIQVHVADAGNQDGWYLVAESGSVDLMSLLNVSLTLGSAAVQTGIFNLISFNITSASITMDSQNITAYVPANRINLPITGGFSVTSGNSSGVLVDLSPEIVPYQNGTSISYVLVPEAKSLPIPGSVWNNKLELKGAKLNEIQNQSWVSQSAAQVVVSGVDLTPTSFSLTLQNQGTTNVSLSSIVLGQLLPLPQCQANPQPAPQADNQTNPQSNPQSGSPMPANDNGSYVSLSTNGSVIGSQTVFISGYVSPSPSFDNTSASILVTDPNGVVVESLYSPVGVSGAFNTTFVAGGSVLPWVGGVYTISATYDGIGGQTTFNWTPGVNSTTSVQSTSTTYTSSNTTVIYTENITAHAPNSNFTVMTNASSYYGEVGVLLYGGLNSAPSNSSNWISIRVLNPDRVVVFSTDAMVAPNGQFNTSFTLGLSTRDNSGRYLWVNGTYTVYAYREGAMSTTEFQWSGPSPVVTSYTVNSTATSSFGPNSTQTSGGFQKYFCSLYSTQDRAKLPPSFPVAYYAILANGTLYPINYTSLILDSIPHHSPNHQGGNSSSPSSLPIRPEIFMLGAGQSVTFTFNGTIDSLTGALLSFLPANFAVPSSLFHIAIGQGYTVDASGPFGNRVVTVVNATAGIPG